MRFYQIDYGANTVSYFADLKATKTQTRVMVPVQREEVRVRLVEIPTDKTSLVLLLNRSRELTLRRIRQWRITAKHRYVEIPADEY